MRKIVGAKRLAHLKQINKKISSQKSYYKKKYGYEIEHEYKKTTDFTSITEYNKYIKDTQDKLDKKSNDYKLVNITENTRVPQGLVKQIDEQYSNYQDWAEEYKQEIIDIKKPIYDKRYGFDVPTEMIESLDDEFISFASLPKVDLTTARTKKELLAKVQQQKERSTDEYIRKRNEQHKANYLSRLDSTFDKYGEGKTLYEVVSNISAHELIKMIVADPSLALGYIYGYDNTIESLNEVSAKFGIE